MHIDDVMLTAAAFNSFPPTWPVYIPAKKLASWLEHYAETMELNVWTSTLVTHARRNDATNKWEVSIRNLKTGVERVLKPAHIVFALGWGGGRGNIPRIPGQVNRLNAWS